MSDPCKKSYHYQELFEDPFRIIVPDVKYRMIDDISVLSMVENGFGISILPKIVTNKNTYLSWAVRTFIRFVQDEKDMSISL